MDSPVRVEFVGLQILATQEDGIGGHPVAFGENDEVAPHDVAAGDPLASRRRE